MLGFLLAVGLCAAQTVTTALDSASLAFTRTTVMTGEMNSEGIDSMTIIVTDPNVRQLRFQLSLKSRRGDVSLAVSTSCGGTEQKWTSANPGSDTIVIKDNDPKLNASNDGLKLRRTFTATVTAASKRESTYELVVSAEYTYAKLAAGTSMEELVKTGETLEVVQVMPASHDVAMLPTESYFWQWTALATAGIALAAGAWVLALNVSQSSKVNNYVYL